MSKKGVSKISGNPTPTIGEKTTYIVTDWYPATPAGERNPATVTWELFKKRSNGSFTSTNIKKKGDGSFTFGEVAAKNTYRLEAYLHEPEGSGPTTIDITPQPAGTPEITKVELRYADDTPGTVFSYTDKLIAKALCVNLTGKKLVFRLWEDDAAGNGHNASNLFVDSKEAIVDRTGTATAEFVLTKALMQKAAQGETDPQKLEFYVTVEYYRNRKHATNNVAVQNPEYREPAQQTQQSGSSQQNSGPSQPLQQQPVSRTQQSGVEDNDATQPDASNQTNGTIEPEQQPTPQQPEGRTTSVVQEPKAESLLDAYFAKEEFTKETDETDGTYTYTFASNNNNINKDTVAQIIKGKVDPAVKKDKKYAKFETIKNALTKTSYARGETISFALYKLGPVFVKINNAPLEEEVYVVATTMLLDGKEVSIHIKEKEPLLIEGDANLPVLEAKENGAEITTLKAVAENGLAKIKIKLRPQSDDTLKEWKEKLTGIKDGTHTYTFGGNGNNTATAQQKRRIAGIIINKIKAELAEQKKFAKSEAIEQALTKEVYNKDEQITFDVYKSVTEYLWLKAECTGNLQKHEGEFLKKDGAYFEIGKKCPRCTEKITIEQIEELYGALPAHKAFRQEVVDNLNKYIFDSGKEIHINTCLRKAHFFAQVGAETLGINPDWMVETDKFRYSRSRSLSIFGQRAANLNAAGLLETYCNENPQRRLMNYMYAAENGFGNGNGNEASGDGYLFRGRGLKQLTGRGNYRSAANYIREIFPDEYTDLEADPDKVKEAKYAVLTAIAFWEKHEIWKTADTVKVSTLDNVKKVRRLVNPGLAGLGDAKSYFDKGINVFKVNSCSPVEGGDSTWHDPIDNPQRTYYNSSGVHREQNGAFGPVRTRIVNGQAVPKNHQGLDIFADVDTPCKACLDGNIVSYTNEGSAGYGNVLVLEVSGEDLRKAKRSYTHEFTAEVESGSGFDINADKFYLRYAHLKSAVKTSGEVTAGETICYSGDSGNASGVPNPHLHFEVAMNATGNGTGLQNRYNPAYFVRLTAIDQPAQQAVKEARS